MTQTKGCIEVSPEMLSFVGAGHLPDRALPHDAVLLAFFASDTAPLLRFAPGDTYEIGAAEAEIVFAVRRRACERLFGAVPDEVCTWHLPSGLRALALYIRDCEGTGPAREALRLARSIELLCQVFAALSEEALIPTDGDAALSELDAARIAAARRIIDERWHEKLTLEAIARACGLNRDKLSRGFRAIYKATVAEVLADKRLLGARQLLLASDLPVSTVGYRCGYLNNASFTRAFSRRFGVAPTLLRQQAIAA